MNRRLQIGYLTVNDPSDCKSWSGTQYYLAQSLQRHCGDVIPLGPIRPRSMFAKRVLKKALRVVSGREYLFTHTRSFAIETAHIAEQRLRDKNLDVIFAPAGSAQVAYLDTPVPIVYSSDTTFWAIQNYYPEFSGISTKIAQQANAIEQMAINNAKLILYPSTWAAESANKYYGADLAKVHVVPYGANLDDVPSVDEILRKRLSEICKLLFVGVDWSKKGGEIAFETLIELERLGVPAQLTIVGCLPPKHLNRKNMRVYRFLSKANPDQRRQLESLYMDSDFFVLPTRAECYGIVFCEANAFGLPRQLAPIQEESPRL